MVGLVLVSVAAAVAMVAAILWVWTTRRKGNL